MGILDKFKLDGKVAIVTGASSGLGVAFAEGLAEAGADIAICARRVERLEETRAKVEATGRRCVAVPADVANLRLIRLVTLDAAERAGLDCDSADDLRIGVEELCVAVLSAAANTDAENHLSLRYRVSAGFVVVHGIARLGPDAVELGLSRVASSILSVVADHFEMIDGGSVVRFGLAKRRIPAVSVST